MTTATQMKTVLVGCGNIGKIHTRTLKNHPEYKLAAVCDVMNEAAQALATELGVKAYTDVPAMLKAMKPDVVIICTSTATHASLTTLAVESGVKGVYCEKPMATNPIVADQYAVRVTWRKGANDVVFAANTNRGAAWGVTCRGAWKR